MFLHLQQREFEQQKFEAAIHGIDLEKELKKVNSQQSHSINVPTVSENPMFFQKPEVYAAMSDEEQEKLGQKMFNHHKRGVGDFNQKRKSAGGHTF